ncbi:MAG: oligosaccharide flippase family protein [Anaerolineales bacterium]|nr:oligosaccharide flippase family protein [Anaerolineales bacterium]
MVEIIQKSRSFISFRTKQLISNSFVQNVIIVASGTAIAEVVKLAAAPVITRLYGPEPFGILSTFSAFVFMLAPLTALSYPISIILPKDDSEALGLVGISFISSLFVVSLIAAFLIIGGNHLVVLLNIPEIRSFLILIPIMLLTITGLETGRQWLFRTKHFNITSRFMVAQALLLNLSIIIFGFIYANSSTLIFLTVLANFIFAFLFIVQIRKYSGGLSIFELRNPIHLFKLATNYYDFPIFRTPQRFINTTSQNLPVLMLASFFGPGAVAFYSLGRKVLVLPSMLIGDALSKVFYPHITEVARENKSVTNSLIKTTAALALLGIIPFGIVVVFGPPLFGLVFGSEWVKAGEYARWLAIWLYFAFLNRPCVAAIPVLSIQGFFLLYEIVGVVFRVVAIYIGFFVYSNDTIAITLFSFVGAGLNIMLILYVFIISLRRNRVLIHLEK